MSTAFDDVRLPVDVEQGALMGPSFQTTIVPLSTGAEQRNADWAQERLVADISYGIMRKDDPQDIANSFAAVMRFYRARMGRFRGFRFRDWSDYSVSEEPFRMINENYGLLTLEYDSYTRIISRPVLETVQFTGLQGDGAWQLLAGGLVLFNNPQTLDEKQVSFDFDVPMRFDTDMAQVNLTYLDAGEIPSIKLIQIREDYDHALIV